MKNHSRKCCIICHFEACNKSSAICSPWFGGNSREINANGKMKFLVPPVEPFRDTQSPLLSQVHAAHRDPSRARYACTANPCAIFRWTESLKHTINIPSPPGRASPPERWTTRRPRRRPHRPESRPLYGAPTSRAEVGARRGRRAGEKGWRPRSPIWAHTGYLNKGVAEGVAASPGDDTCAAAAVRT